MRMRTLIYTMGKVRIQKKHRYHPPAIRKGEELEGKKVEVVPLPEEIKNAESTLLISSSEPEAHIKKKDRRRLRHEQWLQKIETCRMAKEAAKAAEERKKTVIVGDMQPLADALPTLSEDTVSRTMSTEKSAKHELSILREIDQFKKVLQHPAYQKDPLAAISDHIRNSVSKGLT